jgi:hypothetical protein
MFSNPVNDFSWFKGVFRPSSRGVLAPFLPLLSFAKAVYHKNRMRSTMGKNAAAGYKIHLLCYNQGNNLGQKGQKQA